MTIRFRLSLVYSGILALTLLVFGMALYTVQSRDTLISLKQDLQSSNEKLTEAVSHTNMPEVAPSPHGNPHPPKPFDQFSNAQAFKDLREREIVRMLDAAGNLVASPFGHEQDALPFSDEALAAVQQGHDYDATGVVSDENMRIYSRPIVLDDSAGIGGCR